MTKVVLEGKRDVEHVGVRLEDIDAKCSEEVTTLSKHVGNEKQKFAARTLCKP